jgi:hypothetical protein
MEAKIKERFKDGLSAPVSWSPPDGGKEAMVCFKDSLTENLGDDPTGERFTKIADKMMNGDYYPSDAVQFFGLHQDEKRNIKPGDRIQQIAPLGPLKFWSMIEIFVAERTDDTCKIGYVTTKKHHGRGIWSATLTRKDQKLSILVESIASPHSFLFWIGLPVARALQQRAKWRALEEFKKL